MYKSLTLYINIPKKSQNCVRGRIAFSSGKSAIDLDMKLKTLKIISFRLRAQTKIMIKKQSKNRNGPVRMETFLSQFYMTMIKTKFQIIWSYS
jgi:hypothetical protein